MESKRYPIKNISYVDKLKSIVMQYMGKGQDASALIICSEADDLMSLEMKSAAVNILEKEARRIKTRNKIVEKASTIKFDEEIISDETPTDDWISRFFDTVEDITEDTMQNLWAQILAGEVKRPHSFSLRTLDVLRNMTKEDADLFVRVIKSYYFDGYILTEANYGISLEDRISLCEMGLLSPDELNRTITQTHGENLQRLNSDYVLKLSKDTVDSVKVIFDCRTLTRAGRELLQLVDDKRNYEMFAYVAGKFKEVGIASVTLHKVSNWGEDGKVSYFIVPERKY